MTTLILLNVFFVAALAVLCRIPYRLSREDRYMAVPEVLYEAEEERRAA